MSYTITRFHDISCGHRVVGHEGKCQHLHGHNYRVHFVCTAGGKLDSVGRVLDFGVVKDRLCKWLEDSWDHRMLIWSEDPALAFLSRLDNLVLALGIVVVPFNPTAENMARFLAEKIGPIMLSETGVTLVKVVVEETRKCSASYERC